MLDGHHSQPHVGPESSRDRGAGGEVVGVLPNRRCTLNKLPPELRGRNFVTKHRLSMQIGVKRAKNVYATCAYSNWAAILRTTVAGWVGRRKSVPLQPPSSLPYGELRAAIIF